jgi:hypothetical protein
MTHRDAHPLRLTSRAFSRSVRDQQAVLIADVVDERLPRPAIDSGRGDHADGVGVEEVTQVLCHCMRHGSSGFASAIAIAR